MMMMVLPYIPSPMTGDIRNVLPCCAVTRFILALVKNNTSTVKANNGYNKHYLPGTKKVSNNAGRPGSSVGNLVTL